MLEDKHACLSLKVINTTKRTIMKSMLENKHSSLSLKVINTTKPVILKIYASRQTL
jgi:hypothetical protein